jgi:hypothetical protein
MKSYALLTLYVVLVGLLVSILFVPIIAVYTRAAQIVSVPHGYSQSTLDWWSTFHHDIFHKGYSTSVSPSTNRTAWSFTTGGVLESCPVIVDGLLFFGSGDGNFYALNDSTGSQKWNFTTGGLMYSSPMVADGMVFFGSDNNIALAS